MELVEGTATIEDLDAFLARVEEIGESHATTVQAFDARYVVGREHLARAVELARRERDRGAAIARDESVEILLYAAGRRQIQAALEMGVSEGECPAVVVAAGGDEAAAAAELRERLADGETLGAFDPDRVRSFFGIGERELEAAAGGLAGLVRERVAMLVVER